MEVLLFKPEPQSAIFDPEPYYWGTENLCQQQLNCQQRSERAASL